MGHAMVTKVLAADLRTYGAHLPTCAAWGPSHGSIPAAPEKCDCGLAEAVWRAKLVPAPGKGRAR